MTTNRLVQLHHPYWRVFLLVSIILFAKPLLADSLRFSSIQDSTNADIAYQILSKAYMKIGYSISADYYPAKRSAMLANEGRTDGELQRVGDFHRKFPNLLKVPTTLFYLDGMILTANSELTSANIGHLRDYRIGIIDGVVFAENLTANLDPFKVVEGSQLMKTLATGKLDIVIVSRLSAANYIRLSGFSNIKMLEPPLHKSPLYHYLNEKHRHLLPKINQSLIALHQDGTIKTIIDSYIKGNNHQD